MVTAVFNNTDTARVYGLWQWDYGQVLRIQGLSLDPAVEIHFSLQETGGESKPCIGITKDGITYADIPNSMLKNERCTNDYNIYAWIYITDETSGKTTKKIILYVKSRPKPGEETIDTPEDRKLFREAIEAVNESAKRSESAEKSAEAWAHGHTDYPDRDEDNAAYYAGVAGENAGSAYDSLVETQRLASQVHSDADVTAQNTALAAQYKAQAAQSASEALQSEQNAKTSETAAQEAQAGAETAEGQAELYAGQARTDKAAVELIKSEADKTAQKIAEDKNAVQGLVDDFTLTHQQAVANVNNAGQTQTERVENAGETAVDDIETSRQQAVNSVSDEGTTQKEAVKTEGDTQVSNVQAVVDGIAQESTAQQILEKSNQSIPLLEEIAANYGKAGSLNGFGLEKGVNDSVVITYTDPETGEFESASELPTDTTLLKIDEALTGINKSLKIIALQKGVEA